MGYIPTFNGDDPRLHEYFCCFCIKRQQNLHIPYISESFNVVLAIFAAKVPLDLGPQYIRLESAICLHQFYISLFSQNYILFLIDIVSWNLCVEIQSMLWQTVKNYSFFFFFIKLNLFGGEWHLKCKFVNLKSWYSVKKKPNEQIPPKLIKYIIKI